ncbi:MAG: glycosyltransferase family 4 protein [Phycisphaerae bacterium]
MSHGADFQGTKPVRLGYLLRMYPRFSQTFVANEIHELELQGVDVRILSLKMPSDGMFHESVCRVKARAQYMRESHHGVLGRLARSQLKLFRRNRRAYLKAVRITRADTQVGWFDMCRAAEVLRWAKRNRIGHVHVHFGTGEATVAMLAHVLGGLDYSLTLHAFDIFRDNVDRALLAEKVNHSRFTITVSEFNRRFMVENLPGVDPHKIRVNYNGIRLDRFAVGRRCDEEPAVLGLGRLIEKKGFLHLIRAIGLLRDEGLLVRCRIGGEGREEGRLRDEIKRLDLEGLVELLGPLSEDAVRDLLCRSTCFVLPCIQAKDGNIDALPTVLLEALACACPVVTTRLSGNPEIVEDGVSGVLVEPGNDDELARGIREIVHGREWAESLAQAGRRRAEELFDIRRNVAVMREWFVHGRNGARGNGRGDNVR